MLNKQIYCTLDLESDTLLSAEQIINFFDKLRIKNVTIFLETRWVKNKKFIKKLAGRYSIQLHSHWLLGYHHTFGIWPTEDEIYNEFRREKKKLEKIIGKKVNYFRAGKHINKPEKELKKVLKKLDLKLNNATHWKHWPVTIALILSSSKEININTHVNKMNKNFVRQIKLLRMRYPFAKWGSLN